MSRSASARFVPRIVATALLAGLLGACGYKGPLYLPPDDGQEDSAPTSTQTLPSPPPDSGLPE